MFLTMIFLAFQSFILISNSRHLLYRLCEFGKVKVTYKIIFRFILLFQVFKCFNVHKTHSFFLLSITAAPLLPLSLNASF